MTLCLTLSSPKPEVGVWNVVQWVLTDGLGELIWVIYLCHLYNSFMVSLQYLYSSNKIKNRKFACSSLKPELAIEVSLCCHLFQISWRAFCCNCCHLCIYIHPENEATGLCLIYYAKLFKRIVFGCFVGILIVKFLFVLVIMCGSTSYSLLGRRRDTFGIVLGQYLVFLLSFFLVRLCK